MPKLVITRGIPASGKSTYAWKLVEQGYVRVSLDALRESMFVYDDFNDGREKLIASMQEDLVVKCLKLGRNVVVDGTNLHPRTPTRLAALLWERGIDAEWEIADFTDVPVSTSIARNHNDDRRAVPDSVMQRMAANLEKERRKGLWTPESVHRGLPKIEPYVPVPGRRHAVIFDVDGTMAHNTGHRSPYDMAKAGDDAPHMDIVRLTQVLNRPSTIVIVLTGREEKYREVTTNWLYKADAEFDALYMRATGDARRDSIVKYELFDQKVRPHFNVDYVFDDRNQVVSMWRTVGLRVCQVADGDF